MESKRPTIAVLLGNTQTEYSSALIDGFCTCARQENVNLIFLFRSGSPYHNKTEDLGDNELDYNIQFSSIYDYVPDIKPDALIVAYGSLSVRPDAPDKQLIYERYGDVPILMFEDYSENPDIPYLTAENYQGTYALIEHLIVEHGYKKIAYVAGPVKNHDSNERLGAYKDCMEAHGLPVRDNMIIHGDFSEFIDAQVEWILDNNEGIEAIAFGNDNMARSGYRVCARRKMAVGKDIAIVGFDDVNISKNMTPPMTTVGHSSFLYSFTALHKAIMLCNGEKPESTVMGAIPVFRQSCGCRPNLHHFEQSDVDMEGLKAYVIERTGQICDDLYEHIPYEQEKLECLELLQQLALYIYEVVFFLDSREYSSDRLIPSLSALCANQHISVRIMTEQIIELFKELMLLSADDRKKNVVGDAIEFTLKYVNSHDMIVHQSVINHLGYESWFLSTFMPELISLNRGPKENMYQILAHLKQMGIASCYIFLHQKPIKKRGWNKMKNEYPLYFAGDFDDKEMVAVDSLSQPVEPKKGGIMAFLPQEGKRNFFSFVLFAGEEQYGIMVAEIEQSEIFFMLSVSMQLGSLFQVQRLIEAERQATMHLKESMNLIQEQNSILSVISTNDELTKLLNRRGFMEGAIQMMKEHEGKKACVLFADLDHLKEINDCFGHRAGDHAICVAADYLREVLPEGAIIARFGGDEFVAFVMTDEVDFASRMAKELRAKADEFNRKCREDYYIELSAGIYSFVMAADLNMAEVLAHSDEILYQEKKKRRSTVKK